MSRFFFEVQTEDEVYEDLEGQLLPDLGAVDRAVRISVTELICENLRQRVSTMTWTMTVRDEGGRIVARMPFADFLAVP